ncbi:MAG: SRPBCC domain-containing protein [Planctomycetota bacterium]
MLQFEGEESFAVPRAELFNCLTDLVFMEKCIPDLDSATHVGPGKMVCHVRPGFSFVRGRLEITLEVTETNSPDSAKMRVHGKGIGNEVTVETQLRLLDEEGGRSTKLQWSAEITKLGGLLKSVSKGLIQAAAKKVVNDSWASLRKELRLSEGP